MSASSRKQLLPLQVGETTWNTKLKLRTQLYDISAALFAAYSHRFARFIFTLLPLQSSNGGDNFYSIESNVEHESVVEFVNACQHREYEITCSNAHELLLLANEFEVSSLCCVIREFISDPIRRRDLLIPSIKFCNSHSLDSSSYEDSIAECFDEMMSDSILFELPIDILSRIIRKSRKSKPCSVGENCHKFFTFLIRGLDHYGGCGSMLFSEFDFSLLGCDEMAILKDHKSFE